MQEEIGLVHLWFIQECSGAADAFYVFDKDDCVIGLAPGHVNGFTNFLNAEFVGLEILQRYPDDHQEVSIGQVRKGHKVLITTLGQPKCQNSTHGQYQDFGTW